MTTTPEQRAYSRGYQAGRKYSAASFDRQLASAEREDFRQRAALVALAAIMRPGMNWGREVDGKHKAFTTGKEFSGAAFNIADDLCQRTSFTGLLFKASADTRPEGGDAKQAPFTSGAVPNDSEADAQSITQTQSRNPHDHP